MNSKLGKVRKYFIGKASSSIFRKAYPWAGIRLLKKNFISKRMTVSRSFSQLAGSDRMPELAKESFEGRLIAYNFSSCEK